MGKKLSASVFKHPFFNDGADQYISPHNLPVEMDFSKPPAITNPLQVQGFVFHTSHCGSTLLARMLGTAAHVRVVSETEAINGLLLGFAYSMMSRAEAISRLKGIIEYYRQGFSGEEALIFKLTSWNVFFIDLFQEIFPDVAWLYLDRNTDEVVASLMKANNVFLNWWRLGERNPMKAFFDGTERFTDKKGYLHYIIGLHRKYAHDYENDKCRFLNYPGFIRDFESVILPHFGLDYSSEALKKALELIRYESKSLEPVPFKR